MELHRRDGQALYGGSVPRAQSERPPDPDTPHHYDNYRYNSHLRTHLFSRLKKARTMYPQYCTISHNATRPLHYGSPLFWLHLFFIRIQSLIMRQPLTIQAAFRFIFIYHVLNPLKCPSHSPNLSPEQRESRKAA